MSAAPCGAACTSADDAALAPGGAGRGRIGPRELARRLRVPPVADGGAREHTRNAHGTRLAGPGRERRELQLRRRPLPERVAERPPQHLVHERLLQEPDLRLRGVHVDVHAIGRNLDEEVHFRTAFLDRRHAVGLGDGVRDGPVLDDAPVDEDVLRAAHGSLVAKRGDVAVDGEAAGLLADFDEVRALAEQLEEALAQARGRRTLEQAAAAARQREADFGIPERHLRDEAGDLRGLGRVRLEELPARRQVVEEVRDFDGGALGRTDLALGRHGSAVDPDLGAGRAAARARTQGEMRDRRDARQRLATKPERANRRQVLGAGNLAGGMPLDRQPRVLGVHPFAVVLDAQRLLAAELDRDRDPPWRRRRCAFSTSSFTTDAGRSTTSPAAIWLARCNGRRWMRGMTQSAVGSRGSGVTVVSLSRESPVSVVSPSRESQSVVATSYGRLPTRTID